MAKTQFNIRLPPELLTQVDEVLAEINEGRAVEVTRTDLVQLLLTWMVRTRPDFDELNRAAALKSPTSSARSVSATATGAKRKM
jgi:hypothetical protein